MKLSANTWLSIVAGLTSGLLVPMYSCLLRSVLNGSQYASLITTCWLLIVSNASLFMICVLDYVLFTIGKAQEVSILIHGVLWGV